MVVRVDPPLERIPPPRTVPLDFGLREPPDPISGLQQGMREVQKTLCSLAYHMNPYSTERFPSLSRSRCAKKYESVYATCGIHPHESDKVERRYLYELEEFYSHSKVILTGGLSGGAEAMIGGVE